MSKFTINYQHNFQFMSRYNLDDTKLGSYNMLSATLHSERVSSTQIRYSSFLFFLRKILSASVF